MLLELRRFFLELDPDLERDLDREGLLDLLLDLALLLDLLLEDLLLLLERDLLLLLDRFLGERERLLGLLDLEPDDSSIMFIFFPLISAPLTLSITLSRSFLDAKQSIATPSSLR